jgi:hypothetical protein
MFGCGRLQTIIRTNMSPFERPCFGRQRTLDIEVPDVPERPLLGKAVIKFRRFVPSGIALH